MSAASRVPSRATVGWRGRIRKRFSRGDSEAGSVLVEAAFVFPVFILLLFGMIEFGFIFKDSLIVSSMVQAGARTGSEEGNATDPSADYEILSAIKAASGSLGSTINYVVIFNADGTGGNPITSVPSDCRTQSVQDLCNYYTGSFVLGLGDTPPSNFSCNTDSGPASAPVETHGNGCGLPNGDSEWPPSERNVTEINGPDYLGVYVNTTHTTLTGFWKSVTLSDTAIMRLEPQAFTSS